VTDRPSAATEPSVDVEQQAGTEPRAGTDAHGHRLRPARVVDAVLAAAFLVLTVLVARQSGPLALDSRVEQALPPRSGPDSVALLSVPAHLVADAGWPDLWVLLTLAVAGAVSIRRRSATAIRVVAPPVLVEAAAVLILKAALGRVGPPGSALPHPLGLYPSGHTATALVCTGALTALIATMRPEWTRRLRVATVVWTVLIAASLVLLRYHWLTDVIGSLLLGLLILRLTCRSVWAPDG
jgi:undecaprenyl-diphosphatase